MHVVDMTGVQGELIAWVVAGILGTLGASAAFVAWVFRTFLFDRIEKLEDKLAAVEKNGMVALATAVEALRLEVAKQGEHLSASIDATRREIKDDVSLLMGKRLR